MDWTTAIGATWLCTLGWLAGLAVAFGILGRLMPCNPGMYWWKDVRAVATDSVYWFVVPLFLSLGRMAMLVVGLALLFGGRDPEFLPVRQLPVWQQCLAILLLQDVLLYWLHRVFHTRLAWKFHAIHHSPTVLDWMSTQRSHPVNYLLEFGLADVVVLLLGFSPAALVVLAPVNIVYSTMVHANLSWTFGPLRYVFASPVFHRWHHTTQEQGLDKNFASTFPFLDVLFGTFYMPAGRLPEQFGNGEPDFPEHFLGQLLHPFRRKKTADSIAPRPGGAARPGKRAAALTAASLLAVVGLVAGRAYFTAPPAEPVAPPAAGAEQEEPPPPEAATVPTAPLTGHTAAVLSVAVSADGRRVVSGSEDGTVKVWDAATGREESTLRGHTCPVCGVALSPDGGQVVSGGHDRTVRVWDVATGREQLTLTGHTGPVYGVALSPDGLRVVSAGWAMVKVWDARTGQEQLTLGTGVESVLSVAFSPDGADLVTASWETARVWDARTGREMFALQGHAGLVSGVAFSPDGNHVVTGSGDGTLKVWDAATGREERTLAGHTGPVYGVAVAPDGKRFVSGGADGTVKVWDAASGREDCTLRGHSDAVTSVAVSGDGRRLVSGSRDGTLKVWDAQAGGFRESGGLTPAAPRGTPGGERPPAAAGRASPGPLP